MIPLGKFTFSSFFFFLRCSLLTIYDLTGTERAAKPKESSFKKFVNLALLFELQKIEGLKHLCAFSRATDRINVT